MHIYGIYCFLNNKELSFNLREFSVTEEDDSRYYLHPTNIEDLEDDLDDQTIEKEYFNTVCNPLHGSEIAIGFEFSCYTTKDGIEDAKKMIINKINERLAYYENVLTLRKNILLENGFSAFSNQ